jgi:hypothetical protein
MLVLVYDNRNIAVNVSNMENEVKIVVKWSGKEYDICSLSDSDSVGTLKNAIHKATGVRPERQKLLNLKFKGRQLDHVNSNFRLFSVLYVLLLCAEYQKSSKIKAIFKGAEEFIKTVLYAAFKDERKFR